MLDADMVLPAAHRPILATRSPGVSKDSDGAEPRTALTACERLAVLHLFITKRSVVDIYLLFAHRNSSHISGMTGVTARWISALLMLRGQDCCIPGKITHMCFNENGVYYPRDRMFHRFSTRGPEG